MSDDGCSYSEYVFAVILSSVIHACGMSPEIKWVLRSACQSTMTFYANISTPQKINPDHFDHLMTSPVASPGAPSVPVLWFMTKHPEKPTTN